MPSTTELPRWYKALVAMDTFHWDIYKAQKKPEGPCYELTIELTGLDHDGYCSGYSDDVDGYLDTNDPNYGYDEYSETTTKVATREYVGWLPLTDTDGKPWDFEVIRFKDDRHNGCFSHAGSGCCHVVPVMILKSATKIE